MNTEQTKQETRTLHQIEKFSPTDTFMYQMVSYLALQCSVMATILSQEIGLLYTFNNTAVYHLFLARFCHCHNMKFLPNDFNNRYCNPLD